MLGEVSWTTVLVIVLVLVLLAALVIGAIWLVRRWRRRRALAPQLTGASIAEQLPAAWTRFYRDLPPRARHLPTVIVMGDAGAGKTHQISARVDWRGQANQFFPSSVDSPHLQLYLGPDVVVHEVSAPLLRDVGPATRRALARLWRHLGPSATIVVVVDARALAATPPEQLRELAQLVRGKIGAMPARCREGAVVRVCLSHMDQVDGYDELVAVIGAHHGPIDVTALCEPLADSAATLGAARSVMGAYDPNLAYGLTHRTGEELARLVGFYGAFPALLARLAPLLRGLAGDDPAAPHYRPVSLYLGALLPDSRVGDPFTVNDGQVASSIARQRQRHRRGSLAVAAAGAILVGALMWWHAGRVTAAEAAVDNYADLRRAGRGASDLLVSRTAAEVARMRRAQWLWLKRSFTRRKLELEEGFAQELREQYLLPLLRVSRENRSTILYVVALLYASEDNGLRALIRGEVALWASKLKLSPAVVSAYLDVSETQYAVAEPFKIDYYGSQWQSYVFDRVRPLYEQAQARPLTQAQLDDLNTDAPQLYDQREYDVRRRMTALISAQLALATHPPITELLESPLGASEWVESNSSALRGIQAAVSHNHLERTPPPPSAPPPLPTTLGELGADLERILAAPRSGKEVYQVTWDRSAGQPEELKFDVVAWNRKLAEASAAQTIADVRQRDIDQPEQPVGFFPPDTTLRGVGGGGAQGLTSELPGMYTAAAFGRQVAPALDFITSRAPKLGLAEAQETALAELYREQIEDYAARYARELRTYYRSFRFDPSGEQGLPFALTAMIQPGSWFERFLSTVSVNATPKLGDGLYYATMADSLSDFRALAELTAPAKGTIPGIAPYQKMIADLAAALTPAAAGGGATAGGDDAAAPATLASTLSRAGALALGKVTGAEQDRLAQVSGWLTGANIDRDLQAPFLLPVESAYALGFADLDRAIARAWTVELSPLVSPLLQRFPFRAGAQSDVAIADLEAVLRGQGKQIGSFWSAFQRWLGPVTVQRGGRYEWIGGGVTGPAGALATVNDLARLSRALWDADGNPTPIAIKVTPQPLDATPSGGRVPTLAYLRSGAGAIYAFNQRPGSRVFSLQWWDQGASALILELRRPGSAADAATYSVDEADSPWSFYRLLCRAHLPRGKGAQDPVSACGWGRGPHIWDVTLEERAIRPVTLTMDADPWALFRISR